MFSINEDIYFRYIHIINHDSNYYWIIYNILNKNRKRLFTDKFYNMLKTIKSDNNMLITQLFTRCRVNLHVLNLFLANKIDSNNINICESEKYRDQIINMFNNINIDFDIIDIFKHLVNWKNITLSKIMTLDQLYKYQDFICWKHALKQININYDLAVKYCDEIGFETHNMFTYKYNRDINYNRNISYADKFIVSD